MDWLSSLPDDILCHILSFLSTKEAALTSPLAKRWRNLFAFSPNLCFGQQDFVHRSSAFDLVFETREITSYPYVVYVPSSPNNDITLSFRDFLDRLLAVSGNFPLKKLSLKCEKNVDLAHTNRWICNVLSRGGLERLHLGLTRNNVASLLTLPLEIFTCKTLVSLKLGRVDIPLVPENASLPALKTLSLKHILFSNSQVCGFETLLSACPLLEELVMLGVSVTDSCTISCPALQRLTLNWCNFHNLTFDTPSLAYFEYSHSWRAVYPDFNLDSLVEAKLHLDLSVPISSLKNLIKGLKDVKILNLSSSDTMEIFYNFGEAIPVFKNLVHLSTITQPGQCCGAVPFLLKNAPNLETLDLQVPLHYDNCGEEHESGCLLGHSCLLSCRVKVLEIALDSYISFYSRGGRGF